MDLCAGRSDAGGRAHQLVTSPTERGFLAFQLLIGGSVLAALVHRIFFALLVADAMGGNKELLAFDSLKLRQDDVSWIVGSTERLSTELGWRPRHDLAEGVWAAVASMTASGHAAA